IGANVLLSSCFPASRVFVAQFALLVIHKNCHHLRKQGEPRRCLAYCVLPLTLTMKPVALAAPCCATLKAGWKLTSSVSRPARQPHIVEEQSQTRNFPPPGAKSSRNPASF